jgi:cell division protein FtsI/penicillin-binding protein 2
MRETVVDGTAKTLNELEVAVAGKTGTAQIGGTDNTHSWFVGFEKTFG